MELVERKLERRNYPENLTPEIEVIYKWIRKH